MRETFCRAALCAVLVSSGGVRAQTTDACGGVTLQGRAVKTGIELTPGAKETDACLAELAQALASRPDLRGLTVAAYVEDAERVKEKGLQLARAAAEVLAKGSALPKDRIFAVAPRLESPDKPRLEISISDGRSTRPAAFVRRLSGSAQVGAEGSGRAVEAHQLLSAGQRLFTREGALAELVLADGSVLRLLPDSELKVHLDQAPDVEKATPRLELVRGAVSIEAKSPLSLTSSAGGAQMGTGLSRASLRADALWLEALTAAVDARPPEASFAIPAGQSARVAQPPTLAPLLPAPTVSPQSRVNPRGELAWAPVPSAASYRLEWSASADFVDGYSERLVVQPSASLPSLPEGRWFWRVSAVGGGGTVGYPSKVYGVSLPLEEDNMAAEKPKEGGTKP